MNTPEEIDKTADLVRAVTAKLAGPQVIWVLTQGSDDSHHTSHYLYSSEVIARERWKVIVRERHEDINDPEDEDDEKNLIPALASIDTGQSYLELNGDNWNLYSSTLDL